MSTRNNIVERLLDKNNLIVLALVSLIVCVFMQPRVMNRPTYKFQVTFDISQSMKVRDLLIDGTEASRLTVAKQAARGLLQSLPCGSSIGWSVFTGRRVVALVTPAEVCEHYAGLLSSLGFIDSGMRWANASGIGKGLHQSIRAADALDETQIVFITDGQEAPPQRTGHRGMPSTDKYKINGLIVGVGGETPVRIPKTVDQAGRVTAYWQADEVVQKPDAAFGQSHEELSSRQDVHLRKLARLAELNYLPLESPDQLPEAAMVKALGLDKPVPVDLRWIPASLALLFICCRFLPRRARQW